MTDLKDMCLIDQKLLSEILLMAAQYIGLSGARALECRVEEANESLDQNLTGFKLVPVEQNGQEIAYVQYGTTHYSIGILQATNNLEGLQK